MIAANNIEVSTLYKAANVARGLAIDAVVACQSGHLGLPLGCAELGAALFGHVLSLNPEDPNWINRDRFVLSAGHGSLFLYTWLHFCGFPISLEDIKAFRQLGSLTPGHPEYPLTPGVECTTGPLGQGVGNAVGMAVAAKMAEAHFNTEAHPIFDHTIFCLCGDGCLQEGIAAEALSFAGHQKLDNLVLIYDANNITLDATLSKTQSEDVQKRFEALNFEVIEIDGHSVEKATEALDRLKNSRTGKPKILISKTLIGKGIAAVEGTAKAHGESGAAFAKEAKIALGLPETPFYVPQALYTAFQKRASVLKAQYQAWQKTYANWKAANPEKADLLEKARTQQLSTATELLAKIPLFNPGGAIATRVASGQALNALAEQFPLLVSGSADLHGSTKNYIEKGQDFSPECRTGRNLYFGIREHAMGAIVNGFGYYGIFKASGATFLVFSDYMRPALRLAALSHLPIIHFFTHDSVGVGEDGPTHQAVEHLSTLRLIPNLHVLRPADAEETAGALVAALERREGPAVLCLSRQNLPLLNTIPAEKRRNGALRGGYIAKEETAPLELILIATGSEVQCALQAAEKLGPAVRVVSMPCVELFEKQSQAYKEWVLPEGGAIRIAIEAGSTALWHRFTGSNGAVIGIDHFGTSAPGDIVLSEFNINYQYIVLKAQELIQIRLNTC